MLTLGTAAFALAGAWPVGGFAGIELLAAIALFRWHARRMKAGELILLSPHELRIIRTDAAGRRAERRLPAAWLTARLDERPGRSPALMLTGHGVMEEIATDLGPDERRDLAEALQSALYRLRHPRFDNEVLRNIPPHL